MICLCASLRAEDITLRDGRVFNDAKIVRDGPTSVIIHYAGGFSQVEKRLLPDKLLAIHPIDPKYIAEAKAKELAFEKAKEAAEKGDASAQLRLGEMYDNGDGIPKDGAEAFNWYKKAAAQGNSTAQFDLGLSYHDGDGVAKNYAEAIRWYRKSAEQGEAAAQYNLGLMFDKGEGVSSDPAEAIGWYHKAALQGDTSAQVNLGYMYSNGQGVPKDEVEGLAWTYIAAASGDEQSVKNRRVMEHEIGREMALVAQQRSKEILKEIAEETSEPKAPSRNESASPNSPVDSAVKATGSGAIVSTDGVVLTAAHVVAGASHIRVSTVQGIREAKVLGIDEANDVAVLKIDGGNYIALPVASSRGIRLGQTVATIGFPETDLQGFSPKVTKGEISSLNGFRDDPRRWQISAPIQMGNSGGPLLDESGNLIGIIASKLSLEAVRQSGDLIENVNYAVKSNYAQPLLEQYLQESPTIPKAPLSPLRFEDMVDKAKNSAVLILVY